MHGNISGAVVFCLVMFSTLVLPFCDNANRIICRLVSSAWKALLQKKLWEFEVHSLQFCMEVIEYDFAFAVLPFKL